MDSPLTDPVDVINKYYTSGLDEMMTLVHEDATFRESSALLPHGGTWVGPEGVKGLLLSIYSVIWLDIQGYDIVGVLGNLVTLRLWGEFKSKKTGVAVQMTWVEICVVEDGKIRDCDIYYKDPGAVAAVATSVAP